MTSVKPTPNFSAMSQAVLPEPEPLAFYGGRPYDTGEKEVGFSYDSNEVLIVDANKEVVHVPLTTKREVAKRLINLIIDKLKQNEE